MTESQHTPGPWQARFIYRMIKAAREAPGLLMESRPENDWSDACLMAAAPDLLDALVALCDCQSLDFDGSPSIRAAVERARTVIAKLGEEPRP